MNSDYEISNEEMHAFIDGELDPDRAAEFARLVAADPILAARVNAFRSDKTRLDQIFGTLRDLPMPAKWLQLANNPPVRPQRVFLGAFVSRRGVTALAAGVLLMLGTWLVYERISVPNGDTIVAEALAARSDAVQPVQSYDIGDADDRRNRILATELSMPVKAPDLTKLGYRLTVLRVYSNAPGGNAVELGYHNAENRLFTLYLRHPTSPPRVDLIERDGTRVCIWQDEVLGAVMTGEMSAGEMARIASLAYSGLTL
jgi:anti-sigma factor RsiW